MANFNKIILIGRISKDIELRESAGGVKYCSITVAVSRRSKSGAEEQTDFIECSAFSHTAEFAAKWLKKGSSVVVIGELQNNNYEKDGVKHYSYKVLINELQFAESKAQSDRVQTSRVDGAPTNFEEVTSDDKLPF